MRSFLVALALLLAGGPSWADEAVVVGIDRYPSLRPEARLAGCVNDAKLMGSRLERSGFHVTMLTDEQATRAGVLGALAQAGSRNSAGERFVFYFSGHGTGGTSPYLLTADSVEGSFERDLSAADLHSAVLAVPASSRTVLLDSCFSRIFATSRGLGTALRTRHYEKVASRGLAPQDESAYRADTTAHLAASSPQATREEVVYFVASRREEPAQEDEFSGDVHGVFTWYLASRLLSNRVMWGDLQAEVTSLVAERTGDTQHPTLTPGFSQSLVFGGPARVAAGGSSSPGGAAPAAGSSSDAWAVFNRDRVEPGRLDLAMRPAASTMAVGDLLSFTVGVGSDGYLVLVERGVSGRVNLLFPSRPDVSLAAVRAGQTVDVPSAGKAFSPDRPGTERVRALLFGSRAEAAAFLGAFESAPAEFQDFVGAMRGRDLRLVEAPSRDAGGGTWTADVFFQVLPAQAAGD